MKTKKFTKKLQLNKQTIYTFEKEQMAMVKGGVATVCSNCYSATWFHCETTSNCCM